MRSLVSLVLAVFVALIVLQARASACSCNRTLAGLQPCSEYFHSDAVFTGRVAEITVIGEGSLDGYRRSVRFDDVEAFRGIDASSVQDRAVTIVTGMADGDCGYGFVEGESYFVYALSTEDGRLYAGICSRTRPRSEADADVTYARDAAAGKSRPGIYGLVSASSRASLGDYGDGSRPLAGVRVTIDGGGRVYETASDREGRFHVHGIEPGAYRIRVTLPDGYRAIYEPVEQDVRVETEGCVTARFDATTLAAITGTVVDKKGTFASGVDLRLVPEDPSAVAGYDKSRAPIETTDESGRYRFELVPPGKYLVVVNPNGPIGRYAPPYPTTFYLGVSVATKATPVVVVEGGEIGLESFRLPTKLERTTIAGVVVGRDGAPVDGAILYVELVKGQWDGHIEHTGQDGQFRLDAFEGIRYYVRVENRGGPNGVQGRTLGRFEVSGSNSAALVRFIVE